LKNKLILMLILFLSIISLVGCSVSANSQTTSSKSSSQADTGSSITTMQLTKLQSAEIEGSDGNKSYKLENNIINGNINTLSVKMQIINLADSIIKVVWSSNNKEVFHNDGVDHISGDYYSTGVTLSGGFIQSGNYSCEILINNNSVKIINFEIKQLN
jgi:hypothetical protein